MGNLAGSVAMAYCATNLFSVDPFAPFITKLAIKKCSLPVAVAFAKGIAANWLVNVAVYMAACSKYECTNTCHYFSFMISSNQNVNPSPLIAASKRSIYIAFKLYWTELPEVRLLPFGSLSRPLSR